MNKNNFLRTLSLSILLLPLNIYVSESESFELSANQPEITETEPISEQSYWRQYGTTGDAKGEPTQINAISHGCSPSRFRQINVLLTD